MAAIKKSFLVLAMVLLALAGTASAQHPGLLMTCSATAVPPLVRAEGIAELVGDVIAACVTIGAGAIVGPSITTNVTMTLNTNITSNIPVASPLTDSVLVVNEVTSLPLYGSLISNNTLQWAGVVVPVPILGAPATTIRITNVRSNVSQLGIPTLNTFPATQVIAYLSFTGPTTIPITNNVLNVAVPLLGLNVAFGSASSGLQCVTKNIDGDNRVSGDLASPTFKVTVTEGFATAFKTLGVPTTAIGDTQTESGWTSATQATRLIFRFLNIPTGVRVRAPANVWVAGHPGGHSLSLVRVVADSNGASGAVSSGPATVEDQGTSLANQEVATSGGSGYAVYEVRSSNPFATETVVFGFVVGHKADTANDSPAVGTMAVSVSFAPVSTTTTASRTAPEPRFVDTSANWTKNMYSIVKCTTNLLFPFVSNQLDFDTGMVIANTTADDKGTPGQSGKCTLYYFGNTTGGGAAPPNDSTIVLGAGKHMAWTLSGGNAAADIAGAPGFQGYLMALCEFQAAHGFAFITNGFGGSTTIAHGYLALIVMWDGVAGSRYTGLESFYGLGN